MRQNSLEPERLRETNGIVVRTNQFLHASVYSVLFDFFGVHVHKYGTRCRIVTKTDLIFAYFQVEYSGALFKVQYFVSAILEGLIFTYFGQLIATKVT